MEETFKRARPRAEVKWRYSSAAPRSGNEAALDSAAISATSAPRSRSLEA